MSIYFELLEPADYNLTCMLVEHGNAGDIKPDTISDLPLFTYGKLFTDLPLTVTPDPTTATSSRPSVNSICFRQVEMRSHSTFRTLTPHDRSMTAAKRYGQVCSTVICAPSNVVTWSRLHATQVADVLSSSGFFGSKVVVTTVVETGASVEMSENSRRILKIGLTGMLPFVENGREDTFAGVVGTAERHKRRGHEKPSLYKSLLFECSSDYLIVFV